MQTYCIHSCIPIYHAANRAGADPHVHTVEILSYVAKPAGPMQCFSQLEGYIDECLSGYANRYLNDLPEFVEGSCIESVGEVLFIRLGQALADHGLSLLRLEVGETPLRHYCIGLEEAGL